MSRLTQILLSRFDRLMLRLWIAALCTSVLCAQTVLQAQSNCGNYNGCAALQTQSNRKQLALA